MTPVLAAACEKAVHVVQSNGTSLRAGRAALFVLEELGYKVVARVLLLPPLIWFVEAGYILVANHRDFLPHFCSRGTIPQKRLKRRQGGKFNNGDF